MKGAASFSIASAAYAADRPRYPPELFEWMAGMCAHQHAAWDCATGNGQAAIGLSPWFDRVEATDFSAEQIGQALAAPNVRYSIQPAERTDFSNGSFDLVAVAQALHWFDFARFWAEVRRVARPGTFFCAWGYDWFEPTPVLDALQACYLGPLMDLLDRHWGARNRILWNGYRSDEIAFPFERVETPPFSIRLEWGIERLIAYVRTWSAVKAAVRDGRAAAAIARLEDSARTTFAGEEPMPLSLPLIIAAGPVA